MSEWVFKINNKKWFFSGSLLFLMLSSLILGGQSRIASNIRKEERINLLLLECNPNGKSEYPGTILWLSYHPVRRFLDVVTIPSATKIKKVHPKRNKIETIYGNIYKREQNRKKASQAVKKKTEEILGVTIPFYVQMEDEEFIKAIDLLGGIKEPENKQAHLKGKEALKALYRGEEGNYKRIVQHQKLLKEIIKKFKSSVNLFKIPQLKKHNMVSNLTLTDMLAIFYEVKKIPEENIRFQNLPGTLQKKKYFYWIIDREKVEQEVKCILSSGDIKKEDLGRMPAIAVWNAAGVKGLARQIRTMFKSEGVDVVRWGNYVTREEYTVVIDQCGNFSLAGKIAKIINCDKIISQKEKFPLQDISIIVGKDFNRLMKDKKN